VYEVSVAWVDAQRQLVVSTRADRSSVERGADVTKGIFSRDLGLAAGGRRRRPRDEASPPRWTIAVRHREGSLEAVVSRSRTRNLFISLVLIGMLGGAAC